MNKLRLLLFEKCDRNCEGCCNKDWDLNALPTITDFWEYDEVLLTGGEPLLEPFRVISIAKRIKAQAPRAKIVLYTAKIDNWKDVLCVLHYVDGLTVTLHDQSDVYAFQFLNSILKGLKHSKSLRLNIFKNIDVGVSLGMWKVKDDISWIKDCPLPKDETFGKSYLA